MLYVYGFYEDSTTASLEEYRRWFSNRKITGHEERKRKYYAPNSNSFISETVRNRIYVDINFFS